MEHQVVKYYPTDKERCRRSESRSVILADVILIIAGIALSILFPGLWKLIGIVIIVASLMTSIIWWCSNYIAEECDDTMDN